MSTSLPSLISFSDPELHAKLHPERSPMPWEGLLEAFALISGRNKILLCSFLLPTQTTLTPVPVDLPRHVLLAAGFVSTKDAEHLRTRVVSCSPRSPAHTAGMQQMSARVQHCIRGCDPRVPEAETCLGETPSPLRAPWFTVN